MLSFPFRETKLLFIVGSHSTSEQRKRTIPEGGGLVIIGSSLRSMMHDSSPSGREEAETFCLFHAKASELPLPAVLPAQACHELPGADAKRCTTVVLLVRMTIREGKFQRTLDRSCHMTRPVCILKSRLLVSQGHPGCKKMPERRVSRMSPVRAPQAHALFQMRCLQCDLRNSKAAKISIIAGPQGIPGMYYKLLGGPYYAARRNRQTRLSSLLGCST